ncbi:MAG: hypothetical protein KJ734_14740, partial [Chloroflexi bacterium]|nr:hypothetical protein [Chloroflexota bacterium]
MPKYYAFRLAGFLVPFIPQRLAYAIISLLAGILSLLPLPANRAVRANLRQIVGPEVDEAEIRRLVRSALRNNVINYYELFLLPTLSLDQIAQRMTTHGAEYLHQARAANKGLIITTAHFGNFNMA